MNKRLAIIDTDVVVYRAGYVSQDNIHKVIDKDGDVLGEFSKKAEANDYAELMMMGGEVQVIIESEIIPKSHDDVDMIVNTMLKNIVVNSESTDYICHLSGPTNFRNEAATIQDYKGNRKDSVRPVHYHYIREYIEENHPTLLSDNCEADDTCATALYSEFKKAQSSRLKSDCEAILCSIDKDLRNVPGYHYNIASKVIDWVTPKAANRHFALQLLTGDGTDNIPGISKLSNNKKKVGPKTAIKLLGDAETIPEYFEAVSKVYEEFAGDDWEAKLQEVGTLLWMQRSLDEQFDVEKWSQGFYE